jgi:hypothetical protein
MTSLVLRPADLLHRRTMPRAFSREDAWGNAYLEVGGMIRDVLAGR